MSTLKRYCPECGGNLLYDPPVKRFVCKSCGLYITREELESLRPKVLTDEDEKRKRRREQKEYLDWWLSAKK